MSPEIVRVLYLTNVLLGAGTDEIVERIKRDAASVGVSLVDGSVRSSEEIKAAIEAFAGESRGGIAVHDGAPYSNCCTRRSPSPAGDLSAARLHG